MVMDHVEGEIMGLLDQIVGAALGGGMQGGNAQGSGMQSGGA